MSKKTKDLTSMSKDERVKRIKELKIELIKSRTGAQKNNAKTKEIKKAIARLLTFNRAAQLQLLKKK